MSVSRVLAPQSRRIRPRRGRAIAVLTSPRGAAAQSVTGRFTRPDEVADLVVLLASERTGNVTGSDFVIDGGLITTV
ncbi:SDR family oxidoreductase [Streptomyces sp. NPDC057582]|uniref:SDR family oxidoreductase n=1 Tax=Streptomyces sp. NPDC057582 TaxID=3346174 RepID=UPI0036928376